MTEPTPAPSATDPDLQGLGFLAFPEAEQDPAWGTAAPAHRRLRPRTVLGLCVLGTAVAVASVLLTTSHAPTGHRRTVLSTVTASPTAAARTLFATVTATPTVSPAPASSPVTLPAPPAPAVTVRAPEPLPVTAAATPPVSHQSTSTATSSLTCTGPATITVTGSGAASNTVTVTYPGGQRSAAGDQLSVTVSGGAGAYTATDSGVSPHVSLRQVGGTGTCS